MSTGIGIGYIGGAMPSKLPILNFVIEPELLKRVDDFRFKNRFPTRAAAVKWLLNAAITAKLTPKA